MRVGSLTDFDEVPVKFVLPGGRVGNPSKKKTVKTFELCFWFNSRLFSPVRRSNK